MEVILSMYAMVFHSNLTRLLKNFITYISPACFLRGPSLFTYVLQYPLCFLTADFSLAVPCFMTIPLSLPVVRPLT